MTTKKTNAELLKRRDNAIPRGLASATSVIVERAVNAEVWDVEGKRYIDFAAGIAVVNTGHCNPKVTAAVKDQLDKFSHTAFQVLGYETYIALAERLNRLAPIKNAKTLLLTTGAEAVENAIKIARHYTKRPAVISFTGGFHGRSLLTMGLTGKMVPYKAGFGPFPADIYHVPFPIAHHGISEEDSFTALERLFKGDVDPATVAAIILEPVQGEGGFYIAPPSFMTRLRALCDSHGILMICDEIQTGFARTGRIFATEHYDIEPDLITVAKALAGGYPLSGVIGKQEIMDSPTPGGLGGTYGGSPIGCAAAHAVLDIIEDDDLCARSEEIGERLRQRLESIRDRNDTAPIGDIRNLGAMVAFELVKERGGHDPAPELIGNLLSRAQENGLILLSCGIYGNTIRILTPLTISNETLDEGMDILEQSLVNLR